MPRVERTVTFYVCERCGHEWYPRGDEEPRVCPKCKSPYWDRPRQERKNAKESLSR
jgi:rubrerythrin